MTETAVSGRELARRLRKLANLYQHGEVSQVAGRTVDKLVAYEAEQSRAQLAILQADLAAFEREHGMSSNLFYERFIAGQMDDRMDYVEWASLFQMARNLKERLRVLGSLQ